MGLTRFSVPPLHRVTRELAAVAMGRELPDLVVTGARILSTYTERIHGSREVWIKSGRIAAVNPAGSCRPPKGSRVSFFDARGGIVAPGLVDPHIHIESSMMTACAYAEPALLNGTTTIFCDSHEIGNVCDARGIEWMLEDARRAPLSIFLTVPSTVPATGPRLETAGGDLTPRKIGRIFDRWPEAVGLGEKMDFVQVAMGDRRSHAVLREALRRGLPVSGHIYGREFVAAGAASGISDTHEAIDREIADDFLECGVWVFLRGGPPTTPWNSLPLAIRALTELGANPKRVCVCTDDRDADDLFLFGMDWVVRSAVKAGIRATTAWSLGSLHPATRFGMDGEIGGLAPARRADLVLLNDTLEPQCTWFGGELVVRYGKVTPALERALSRRYRYPRAAYETVKLPEKPVLVPALPKGPVTANVIRTALHKIILLHDRIPLQPPPRRGMGRASRAAPAVLRHGRRAPRQVGRGRARPSQGLRAQGRGRRELRGPRRPQYHPGGKERARHAQGPRRNQADARRGVRRARREGRREGRTPGRGAHLRQTGYRRSCRDDAAEARMEGRRLHAPLHGLQPDPPVRHPRDPHHGQGVGHRSRNADRSPLRARLSAIGPRGPTNRKQSESTGLCGSLGAPMTFDFDTPRDRRGTDSQKWQKYAGRDVLPMWVADMDFEVAPAIVDALHRRVAHGIFGYARPAQSTVDAVVGELAMRHGWKTDPSWIVWLPGLGGALNVCVLAFADAGDEVLSLSPVYPPFSSAPRNGGRVTRSVPLALNRGARRWEIDWDALEGAVTPRTRVLLFCHPHNPVARVWSRDEIARIAGFCARHSLVLVSDEIHCDLLLDPGAVHEPLAAAAPPEAARTVTLMAPSKI